MQRIACADIGINGCDYAAPVRNGNVDEAAWSMLEHLRKQHGYDLSLEAIYNEEWDDLNDPERMVAARLHRQVTGDVLRPEAR